MCGIPVGVGIELTIGELEHVIDVVTKSGQQNRISEIMS